MEKEIQKDKLERASIEVGAARAKLIGINAAVSYLKRYFETKNKKHLYAAAFELMRSWGSTISVLDKGNEYCARIGTPNMYINICTDGSIETMETNIDENRVIDEILSQLDMVKNNITGALRLLDESEL